MTPQPTPTTPKPTPTTPKPTPTTPKPTPTTPKPTPSLTPVQRIGLRAAAALAVTPTTGDGSQGLAGEAIGWFAGLFAS